MRGLCLSKSAPGATVRLPYPLNAIQLLFACGQFGHLSALVRCLQGLLARPVWMDSQTGMCEWVSDSRESAWLANPCKLRIRITDVLCSQHVGSAYGRAIRTISRRLVNHCRIRANPLGLRIHANCESVSQCKTETHRAACAPCLAARVTQYPLL